MNNLFITTATALTLTFPGTHASASDWAPAPEQEQIAKCWAAANSYVKAPATAKVTSVSFFKSNKNERLHDVVQGNFTATNDGGGRSKLGFQCYMTLTGKVADITLTEGGQVGNNLLRQSYRGELSRDYKLIWEYLRTIGSKNNVLKTQ
jgi:hypothetical protein